MYFPGSELHWSSRDCVEPPISNRPARSKVQCRTVYLSRGWYRRNGCRYCHCQIAAYGLHAPMTISQTFLGRPEVHHEGSRPRWAP